MALAIAGGVGVLLSIGLVMTLLLNLVSLAVLIAALVYLVGLVAVILLTTGRGGAAVWFARLLAPLPAALLLWAGLAAVGL